MRKTGAADYEMEKKSVDEVAGNEGDESENGEDPFC